MQRLLQPIKNKILLLIGRAILTAMDNTKKTQKIQIKCLKGETLSDIERLEDFGFTSNPPVDGNTECLVLFLNGNRDFGIAIKAHNRELRPKTLAPGESAMYNSAGDLVHLTAAGLFKMLGATEAFLKGTTFDAWLSSFTTWAGSHTHTETGAVTLPPLVPPPVGPTGHLSVKIKGE